MQIHRIHGANLKEALERARLEHGEGAVVLSQEALSSGAVTIAVADARALPRRRREAARPEPGLTEVRERLQKHGASKAMVDSAARAVRESGVKGAYTLDVAARFIGKAFALRPAERRHGVTRILALVGPTGAGKTTTLAKLGRRLIEAGRSVMLATLDGLGTSELEMQARAEAESDRHELAILSLATTAEIDEKRMVESRLDALLLDTAGVPPRDGEGLRALAAELARLGTRAEFETHLVVPATLSLSALELALSAYAALKPSAIVITKLDEAPAPAPVLERCRRTRLPFSFLCDGPDARGHLRRARPSHFADLFLRGRIAG
jgi:flagellar biosynthesis protein FlhF